ncbi:MAG: hypothetical protein IJJ83_02820 [Muribaculaceae bacterium]|jgi:hypothetical protein|nr:hypothetical protein [Muribaculaceae bacterium]
MVDLIKPFHGESEESFIKRKAYYYRILKRRFEYGDHLIKNYSPNGIPISESDKEEIDAFWDQFLRPELRDQLVDYRFYDVFKNLNKGKPHRLSYYIPDTFYYAYIDEYFTNPQHSGPCDAKNLYDLYFYDVYRPKTIFRKVDDFLLDSDYDSISLKDAIAKCKDEGEVVLKVAKFSSGGHGVMFWNSAVDSEEKLIDFLHSSKNIICQEVIKQHSSLSVLNPSSVNTIRVFTFAFKNEIYMLSSFIRFGGKGSRVDNSHSGGLACGLEKDGRLKADAFDLSANRYDYRPEGRSLNEIVVPNYDKCVELATNLARRCVTITSMVSWDFAIDEKGEPVLIEIGTSFGGLNFHQICNGPIFGDMTEEVLDEVFKNSYTLNSILKSIQ